MELLITNLYSIYVFIFAFVCTWREGIVAQESVERFRKHLTKLQNMKDLTSEEKG